MKNIMKYGYIIASLFFITYLYIPNPPFPQKPSDALQSDEPADTESILRRAYFTNYDREEIMHHYTNEAKKINILGISFPTHRLNYPPEEAQTIIRDQTRSTFLEEIVHPFRESIFVNGFKPKTEKDAIIIQGRKWEQKIIIKQVKSNAVLRLILALLTLIIIPTIWKNVTTSITEFRKNFSRLWIYR